MVPGSFDAHLHFGFQLAAIGQSCRLAPYLSRSSASYDREPLELHIMQYPQLSIPLRHP
jgi:hypothetical protein